MDQIRLIRIHTVIYRGGQRQHKTTKQATFVDDTKEAKLLKWKLASQRKGMIWHENIL